MSNQPANLPTSVALRIIETTPAVVKFNYEEMEANLDAVLVKYQGLTFTDSDAAECKKTIAELRKGQKALSDFRIKTKKELTESVTDFEKQCKKLHDKFETVISPLTTQNDQFELDRRELKRVEIKSVIDSLIADRLLSEKYAVQLVILEEYFNKGKSLKAISKELAALADTLSVQEDKEAQDIDLIKTKVELANAQYQLAPLNLTPEQYLRLLSYQSVTEIDLLITADAQSAKKAIDALKATKEAEVPEVVETTILEPVELHSVGNSETHSPVSDELDTKVYSVTGTQWQLCELEAYLAANNFSWTEAYDDDLNEEDEDFMN